MNTIAGVTPLTFAGQSAWENLPTPSRELEVGDRATLSEAPARARTSSGRFRAKRGDTHLETLRHTYGLDFAAGLPGNMPLALLRAATGMSLSQMLKRPEAVQKAVAQIRAEPALIRLYEEPPTHEAGPARKTKAEHTLERLAGLEGGYTWAHMKRATDLSLRIAEALGLSSEDRAALQQAGKFYDAGKLDVPPAILDKTGKFTDEEFAEMKRHVDPQRMRGYLEAFEASPRAREAALYHHERYDGRGYPTGKAGEEIPLTARILAVADAFDSMTCKRWNRLDRPEAPEALTPQAALEILQRNAGTQFDPSVVQAMTRMLSRDSSESGPAAA